MKKMFPWVKTAWESLDENSRRELANTARLIRKTCKVDTARDICQKYITDLCDKYDWINRDVGSVPGNFAFLNPDVVPASDLQFIDDYFEQFSELYPEDTWDTGVDANARRFKVKNDYHGIIECILVSETPTAYFFDYIKDGVKEFENWKVLKTGSRVIEEIF